MESRTTFRIYITGTISFFLFYFSVFCMQPTQPSILITQTAVTATAKTPVPKTSQSKPNKTKKKTLKKQRPEKMAITLKEAETRGVYGILKMYIDAMCIKEIPFFISLHRCFYNDRRISTGDTLVLDRSTLQTLKQREVDLHHINELMFSSIRNVDSLYLYKERKNKSNEDLCNFMAFVHPGSYDIPKTGASVQIPAIVAGSIHYSDRTGRMVVYMHTSGIRLELPTYAKALTFGLISDMDIGFAELFRGENGWTAALLYTKGKESQKKTGWSFNLTECNSVRPFSEE
jgi:hypothetical protein